MSLAQFSIPFVYEFPTNKNLRVSPCSADIAVVGGGASITRASNCQIRAYPSDAAVDGQRIGNARFMCSIVQSTTAYSFLASARRVDLEVGTMSHYMSRLSEEEEDEESFA